MLERKLKIKNRIRKWISFHYIILQDTRFQLGSNISNPYKGNRHWVNFYQFVYLQTLGFVHLMKI